MYVDEFCKELVDGNGVVETIDDPIALEGDVKNSEAMINHQERQICLALEEHLWPCVWLGRQGFLACTFIENDAGSDDDLRHGLPSSDVTGAVLRSFELLPKNIPFS